MFTVTHYWREGGYHNAKLLILSKFSVTPPDGECTVAYLCEIMYA